MSGQHSKAGLATLPDLAGPFARASCIECSVVGQERRRSVLETLAFVPRAEAGTGR